MKMRLAKVAMLFLAVFAAQACIADDQLHKPWQAYWYLQKQINRLTVRTQALEDAAPTQSVEGRDYCFVLNLQIMRGRPADGLEELQNNVIRRKVNFSNGMVEGALLSNVLNNQLDDGNVLAGTATTIPNLLATYVQTGSKIDVAFGSGDAANWYVSKDGSLIHGAMIRHRDIGPPGESPPVVTIGTLRSWTMVETAPNDVCDAEEQ
jgi:hypothetical protein